MEKPNLRYVPENQLFRQRAQAFLARRGLRRGATAAAAAFAASRACRRAVQLWARRNTRQRTQPTQEVAPWLGWRRSSSPGPGKRNPRRLQRGADLGREKLEGIFDRRGREKVDQEDHNATVQLVKGACDADQVGAARESEALLEPKERVRPHEAGYEAEQRSRHNAKRRPVHDKPAIRYSQNDDQLHCGMEEEEGLCRDMGELDEPSEPNESNETSKPNEWSNQVECRGNDGARQLNCGAKTDPTASAQLTTAESDERSHRYERFRETVSASSSRNSFTTGAQIAANGIKGSAIFSSSLFGFCFFVWVCFLFVETTRLNKRGF